MKYVSHFDLLQIRTRLQATTGQSFDVMNSNMLQAALAAPRQSVFGEEAYPALLTKAAVLFVRLIKDHPFIDGNKRIATEALRLFLQRNRAELTLSHETLHTLAREVATTDAALPDLERMVEQRLKQALPPT